METVRLGVLGAADIAKRRFLPALKKCDNFRFVGIAVATNQERGLAENGLIQESKLKKAEELAETFGGKVFEGYQAMLDSDEIDAVYIPLPPSLHFKWGARALSAGKHILMEKPAAIRLQEAEKMLTIAEKDGLAFCENYAFLYHKQMKVILSIINSGKLGELRLIRTAFGFPYRSSEDFRYHAALGGGALLDCGGYTLSTVCQLLGEELTVETSFLNMTGRHDVDIYGSATLKNSAGLVAQIGFGMDNSYKCDLEVWGSRGYLETKRMYTPPADLETEIVMRMQSETESVKIPADDQFLHMIEHFYKCINSTEERKKDRNEIVRRMSLLEKINGFKT